MAVNLSPVFGVAGQLFDNNGNPLAGGKIYTYLAGTTTNATTYTNNTGGVAHSNPIVLNGAGRVPSGEIWLTDGISYKFVVEDSANNLIGTYDNLTGINSNFVAYTNSQEIQTATAGQTVFTLTTIQYQPGTNSLSVFVDGVNQYGPGAQYSYVETDTTTVTFVNGLHVGASVKFTTSQLNSSGSTDASLVTYDPPFPNSVSTNVEAKLAQTVSVLDFGANPTGSGDSTAAFQAAVDTLKTVYVPEGTYNIGTVSISMQGCEIIMHEKAYLIVSGAGIQRDIQQVTRAAYIAANSTIDGYNYYDTLKVSGGNIILGANAIGVADRIPFLQYIGAPPTPSNPNGLQPFKTPMLVSNVAFILQEPTSLGVAIHGGWGSIVENCTFTGYDCGKAIYINGDGTFNPSSQPQLITIQNNSFNSCTPIDAVKGTCTNSCEALNILGNKFNFVQAITLNTVNAANIIGNYIIFNDESMRIVDSGAVILSGNYLQVAQQHTSVTHECVVAFVNSARAVVTNNEIVIDNLANNRNGFGFYTNNVNDYFSIQVSYNTFSKSLTGGSAIRFVAPTAPFTFENVNISNIIAPYFSYVVNFFDVVGGDARNVSIRDLFTEIGDGTIFKVVGLSRLDIATFDAPQFFQKEKLSLRSSANNSGIAGECMVYTMPTTVTDSGFTTAISNFVNTSNCVSITATNDSGSVRVILGQVGSIATGAIVSGTADLEIYGDIN